MKRIDSSQRALWCAATVGLLLGLVASQPAAAQCPFGSVQARVQPDIATPWTRTLAVDSGQSFRVGGFYDNTGLLDTTGNVGVHLSGPNGYESHPENGSYVVAPYVGTYTLTATCGDLSDSATITVWPGTCPFGSIQARVQPNIETDWTPSLSVDQDQSFRVGGFYDGTGLLDTTDRVSLLLSGPNGYASHPQNGIYLTVPEPGRYTLRASCGSLSDEATIWVSPNGGCPFGSIQTRVQPNVQTDWTSTLAVAYGQSFRIGGFYDGTGLLDTTGDVIVRVTGPDGFDLTPPNGEYVTPTSAGEYVVTGTCGDLSDTAVVTVASGPDPGTILAGLTMSVGRGYASVSATGVLTLTAGSANSVTAVRLAASLKSAAGAPIPAKRYEWQIDNSPFTRAAQVVQRQFTPGSHSIRVRATDDQNQRAEAAGQVYIRARDQTAEPVKLAWPFTDRHEGADGWHCFAESPEQTLHYADDIYAHDWNWRNAKEDRGRALLSPGAGRVIFAGRNTGNGRSYGRQVIILLNGTSQTRDYAVRFAHLESIWVDVGQAVCAGTPIGRLGSSGTTAYHLHAAVYQGVFQQNGMSAEDGPTAYDRLRKGEFRLGTASPSPYATRFRFDSTAAPTGCASDRRVVEGRVLKSGGGPWGDVRVRLRGILAGGGASMALDMTLGDSGNFAFLIDGPLTNAVTEYRVVPVPTGRPGCTFTPRYIRPTEYQLWLGDFVGSDACR